MGASKKRWKIPQPMFNKQYTEAIKEWYNNHILWLAGNHPDQLDEELKESASKYKYFAEWDNDVPEIEYYNHYYTPEEATRYQVYETTTEGTPISPIFESKEQAEKYEYYY